MKICLLALLLIVAPLARPAAAAPTSKPEATAKKTAPKPRKHRGMVPSLTVGLNFLFNQSQGVVGVPDGVAMALGLTLRTGLDFHRGPHRWRTLLLVQEAATKVPGIKPFINGTDLIEVTSVYTYRFGRVKWLSVYGGVRIRSNLLEGNLIRGAETQLQLTNVDGDVFTDVLPAQTPYPLTEFLAPLILEQFAGASFAAVKHHAANLSFRAGLVAGEVISQGGYVVHDDEATPNVIELVQMRDYVQGGAEAGLSLSGRLADKLLEYRLGVRVMFPFATSVETDLGYDRLIDIELRAALSIRIFSWASLEYSLTVERMELLTPGWQVANLLMLSVTASVGPKVGRWTP